MQYRQHFKALAADGSWFLYDLDALRAHAQQIVRGSATLFFACKANPLGAILSTLQKVGVRFDVSSEGELRQVLAVGSTGEHIMMTGPAKSRALLTLALKHRVNTFVIESASQLFALQDLAKSADYRPNVLLRLQLSGCFEEQTVLGGKEVTAFGMDIETAQALLPKVELPLLGFHVFQWNNVSSIEKLRKVWEKAIQACKMLQKDFEIMDVGGGLGIPYRGEAPLDWKLINDLVLEMQQKYDIPSVWLEMGRYLTGPYGTYATHVVDRKHTHGKELLVLAGGINHLARPALLGQSFPVSLLRESRAEDKNFSLYGPLCTALDCLGNHRLPADVAAGDVLLFGQAGAYGFTESMPFFLCHHLPGEAVIEDGKLLVARAQETAQFWLK